MYTTLNEHYRQKFGCKVYKLSIDAGFTCPNRDGKLGTGGCIFCSAHGGGEFAENTGTITQQLAHAKARVASKNHGGKYIAYFQAFSNTYAPPETLEHLYLEVLAPEDIVGLSIGTRPDCLPDETIALLARMNQIKPVSVELGLQTIHPATASYIRRGYSTDVYLDAVKRLRAAEIDTVTHLILGLPGETTKMMVDSTRQAVQAGTNGIKFHLLHVLRNTDLEKEYLAGKFRCLSLEEYSAILKQCLEVVPKSVVVHRITGDGHKRDLVAPTWSGNKKRVLNHLNQYLKNP